MWFNRNKKDDLLTRLKKASDGHVAVNGPDGPNVFSEAKAELDRLYEIEALAQSVYAPLPDNDEPRGSYGPRPITAKSAKDRLENGWKLGVAIGVFKEKDGKDGD